MLMDGVGEGSMREYIDKSLELKTTLRCAPTAALQVIPAGD